MTANQTPAATPEQLDAARATLAGVRVGQRLTAEQRVAQELLGRCRPGCRCGDCPETKS